ncbi:hypothetical protein SPRG_11736 [Saprolegnia parasitica CBS 223.65]|uniref:Uncharacterized protein n=1 Tax=Saprolegnia parasitica (strain CBS 223.65) TaxID=695850 RepID=A0A067BVJ7_SAPPC|nr:hypothetical protein SPRG_11736 [Saprolegnia parasitica CBS 223.65]KDO22554.1 hypothetical protein SPRG_11736 [Saprolegnia parasitica CBS 223.65]|eukprot:XP_012206800.1 hypothetical protein SPRG_11736 [Saprolegnia parasitica CBS 223.65]
MDKDALRRQHAWSLLRSSTISMPLAATYLSALFQRDDVLTELQREDAMAKAHAIATERNTLTSRILHLYPSDKDAVEYTAHVAVRFGGDVIDVDCLRVITVKNVTLGVRVSGAVAFDLLSRTATFVPTVPLEARSTFKLKLRAEAVTSWLGPVRSTLKLSFSTKPK